VELYYKHMFSLFYRYSGYS